MGCEMVSSNCILILGSSGMIGSAVSKKLSLLGHKHLLQPSHSELDVSDLSALDNFFQRHKIDIVINCVGKVGGILENRDYPYQFIAENLQTQLNVCLIANKYETNTVVFFGSSCMYPKRTKQPMPVSALLTGSLEPTSLPYAISKLAGLHLGLAYNQQYKKNRYITVIPNSTFGPGDNFDQSSGHVLSVLIDRFHKAKNDEVSTVKLWGSGKPRREFIFSDDVADAIIYLLEHRSKLENEPINIGVNRDYAIEELANVICNVVGYKGKILWDPTKPDGAPQKLLDSSKIRNLGWSPSYGLSEGIQLTYDWYIRQKAVN